MKSPAVGEPFAVCGFQFTFPCAADTFSLASVSTQDASTKKTYSVSSSALMCWSVGSQAELWSSWEFITPTTSCIFHTESFVAVVFSRALLVSVLSSELLGSFLLPFFLLITQHCQRADIWELGRPSKQGNTKPRF